MVSRSNLTKFSNSPCCHRMARLASWSLWSSGALEYCSIRLIRRKFSLPIMLKNNMYKYMHRIYTVQKIKLSIFTFSKPSSWSQLWRLDDPSSFPWWRPWSESLHFLHVFWRKWSALFPLAIYNKNQFFWVHLVLSWN